MKVLHRQGHHIGRRFRLTLLVVTTLLTVLNTPPASADHDTSPAAPADHLYETAAGCALPGVDDWCEAVATVWDDPEGRGPGTSGMHGNQFYIGAAMSPSGDRVYRTERNIDQERLPNTTNWATVAYDSVGDVVWVARVRGSAGTASPGGVVVSPDGMTVFVTGYTVDEVGDDSVQNATTVAYDASTGQQRWLVRYPRAGGSALAVSPDGRQLYVTGYVGRDQTNPDDYGNEIDALTIAYDAATGNLLWDATYGDASIVEAGTKLAVSPAGDRLYVSGTATDYNTRPNKTGFFTLAYRVAELSSTARVWISRQDPTPSDPLINLTDMDVSPDGSTIFLTAYVNPFATTDPSAPALTIALDATSGDLRWEQQYALDRLPPNPGLPDSYAFLALTPSPDGKLLFAAGGMWGDHPTLEFDGLIVAYDAATGEQLWANRYDWGEQDYFNGVATSPDGRRVYVTGSSMKHGLWYPSPAIFQYESVTIAYDASTGDQLSTARRGHIDTWTQSSSPFASPDGKRLYVMSAISYDPLTDGGFLETLSVPMDANTSSSLTLIYDTSTTSTNPAVLNPQNRARRNAIKGRSVSCVNSDNSEHSWRPYPSRLCSPP